jgi:hypothetical protein
MQFRLRDMRLSRRWKVKLRSCVVTSWCVAEGYQRFGGPYPTATHMAFQPRRPRLPFTLLPINCMFLNNNENWICSRHNKQKYRSQCQTDFSSIRRHYYLAISSNMALLTLLANIRKRMWLVMATPRQPVHVYTWASSSFRLIFWMFCGLLLPIHSFTFLLPCSIKYVTVNICNSVVIFRFHRGV